MTCLYLIKIYILRFSIIDSLFYKYNINNILINIVYYMYLSALTYNYLINI